MTGAFRSVLGKIAALAILVSLAWFVLAAVVMPLAAAHRELADGIADGRVLLGRLDAAERRLAARAAEAADKTQAHARPVWLEGESDGIRLAGLQARVATIAGANGARFDSTLAVEPRDEGSFRLVGIQSQLAVTLEALQRILIELDAAEPPLIVDQLHVSARAGASPDVAELLDVRLTVRGATPPAGDGP